MLYVKLKFLVHDLQEIADAMPELVERAMAAKEIPHSKALRSETGGLCTIEVRHASGLHQLIYQSTPPEVGLN